ncbi:hypothetical protein [Prevotella sp. AGR2160]|uniref:hypothetical protein n=1 Tax=Prevotella sp. AGR2160 TaxID=1280674 RepID=UPI0012DFDE82|nr:hypothetical protein [Prevotella sp. AGR2160]
MGKQPLLKAVKAFKGDLVYDYQNFNGIAVTMPEGTDMDKAIDKFKKVKGVLTVERDRVMQLQ